MDNKIFLVVIDDLNNKKILCDVYINFNKKKNKLTNHIY